MFRTNNFVIFTGLVFALVLSAANSVWAQSEPPAAGQALTLKQVFDATWQRQPEAQSLDQLQVAANARRQLAENWLVAPPTLEVSGKTDQLAKNQGNREYVAGFVLPLWLPGERARTGALAEASARAVGSRASAAQLRTSAVVRDAWWNWQRMQGEKNLAAARLENARRLSTDVAKRVKAGDLARADQHQADGATASAEVILAEADALLAAATQQLRSLTGSMPRLNYDDRPEPPPAVPPDFSALDASHPAVRELFDRAETARRAAELAAVQSRNNPELLLMSSQERSLNTEAWQQNVSIGLRIPFGSEARQQARLGLARAEAIESESALRLERERLASELDAARVRVESAHVRREAAERRARLARESRAFFEKSFRLGETDLPTRLRIELETVEAERQSARARIDLATALSTLRQTLGLLPE
jgi:cobalt-zinc-cadmium efflux system outer membrane protein